MVFGPFQMLEQDIAGRQSSINAMNEKVKRFTETTDPSTASSLQARMKDLAFRFSEASHKVQFTFKERSSRLYLWNRAVL